VIGLKLETCSMLCILLTRGKAYDPSFGETL
jgi:hypothetical protein